MKDDGRTLLSVGTLVSYVHRQLPEGMRLARFAHGGWPPVNFFPQVLHPRSISGLFSREMRSRRANHHGYRQFPLWQSLFPMHRNTFGGGTHNCNYSVSWAASEMLDISMITTKVLGPKERTSYLPFRHFAIMLTRKSRDGHKHYKSIHCIQK